MSRTWAALAATLAAGLAGIAVAPYYAVTPGVLIAGHEAKKNDCFACHSVLRGAPRTKCLACHPLATLGLATSAGGPVAKVNKKSNLLHQQLKGECSACHTEHRGRSRENAMAKFTHELLSAELLRDCASCHPERPADGLHGEAAAQCAACHGTRAWKPATFEHGKYFRFDREHPARCADCHQTKGTYAGYTCYGCHEHTPANMASEHREEGLANFEACVKCHRSANKHETVGGEREGDGRENEPEREDD
jgi:hypothetical protein